MKYEGIGCFKEFIAEMNKFLYALENAKVEDEKGTIENTPTLVLQFN